MGVQFRTTLCTNLLMPEVYGIDLNEPSDVGPAADGAVCFQPGPEIVCAGKGIKSQDVGIVNAEWI